MKRRNFLFAMIAAAALDPERLLWTPSAKTISIPAPPKIVEPKWTYFTYDSRAGKHLVLQHDDPRVIRMSTFSYLYDATSMFERAQAAS